MQPGEHRAGGRTAGANPTAHDTRTRAVASRKAAQRGRTPDLPLDVALLLAHLPRPLLHLLLRRPLQLERLLALEAEHGEDGARSGAAHSAPQGPTAARRPGLGAPLTGATQAPQVARPRNWAAQHGFIPSLCWRRWTARASGERSVTPARGQVATAMTTEAMFASAGARLRHHLEAHDDTALNSHDSPTDAAQPGRTRAGKRCREARRALQNAEVHARR